MRRPTAQVIMLFSVGFVSLVICLVCFIDPSTVAVEPQGNNQRHAVPATVVAPSPGLTIDGEIVRVIDGDTVVVRSYIEYQIRLLDCWAPESRTRDAEEKSKGLRAKARMQELAGPGQIVRVNMAGHTAFAESITMGRILGRVWVLENGIAAESDLSAVMVSEGLATTTKDGER